MNLREHAIKEKYSKLGLNLLHDGAPDFLAIKTENGKIVGVKFVEVKSPSDKLTYNQKVWRDALRFLGAECIVEVIE